MPAHIDLTDFAIVALAALGCGMVLARLKQPAVVGYILAGVILGPSVLGFVTNRDEVEFLAQLGVLMLLYLVGMELSLRGFKPVWRVAMLAVLLQLAGGVLAMLSLSLLLGWPIELAVLLGFVVSLSSTAVAIKMLEDLGELRTRLGQITVAVLIAQDLAVAPLMLIANALGGRGFGFAGVLKLLLAVGLLAALTWYLSRRQRIHLPFAPWLTGSADLTAVGGLAFCFAASALSGLVGLSPAYGAFLAGLVIGNSAERHAVLQTMQPIQSVLMMVFFVSIGLLVDLGYIADHIGEVLAVLVIITLFKTALNVGLLRLLGEPWTRAYFAGVLLSQIGEFSFLLAAIALGSGVIDPTHYRLVVAVTVLSLATSPFWMASARRVETMAILGVSSGSEIFRSLYGERLNRWLAAALAARRGPMLARLGARRRNRGAHAPAAPAATVEAPTRDASQEAAPAEPPSHSPRGRPGPAALADPLMPPLAPAGPRKRNGEPGKDA
jgi:CPA2 family monovalent cation:H+ antiporter-2